MAINFPTSLDSLTNPTAGNLMNAPSHSAQHSNINDIGEALEAKVGIDGSAVTTSHDYKLSEVTGVDKAVGKAATQTLTNKTLTSPTITTSSISGATITGSTISGATITSPAISGATIATSSITGAGGTTAGELGYDGTDKILKVGDGTANQSIYTSSWKTFTPSWTFLTTGNGTNTGSYSITGKHITVRTRFFFGTTSVVVTTPVLTFPVSMATYTTVTPLGIVRYVAAGVSYVGAIYSDGALRVYQANSTFLIDTGITAAVPNTFTTNDSITTQFSYEIA